jgi:hypothetical protein
LAARAENAYALFNNNRWSPSPSPDVGREVVAQAAANAVMLRGILEEQGVEAE